MTPPETIQPPTSPANPAAAPRHPRPLGGDTARQIGNPLVSLSGYVLNNQAERSQLSMNRKPAWIRAKMPGGEGYQRLKAIINEHRLHTVCEEATCPNIGECWSRGTATIMILGEICTRACGFCNVRTGKPLEVDRDEPRRVAESLKLMDLTHVVITCVDRDDLPDGGASIWAETIRLTREACPTMSIEALTGDFKGSASDIRTVIEAKPNILAHNLETVKRMHPAVRPQAKYERSLDVLRQFKSGGITTKTSLMVGIGEHDDEILQCMEDIRAACDADILTLGQYLQPTRNHLPISRWVTPEQFAMYKSEGLKRGFRVVESGPLVRSSYHAEEQAKQLSPCAHT